MKTIKRLAIWVLLGLVPGFLLAAAFYYELGARWERVAYDTGFNIRGEIAGHPDVVFIDIDDKAIEELQLNFPIPRNFYADLIEALDECKIIAFDIFLTDPTPLRPSEVQKIKEHMIEIIVEEIFNSKDAGLDSLKSNLESLSTTLPKNAENLSKLINKLQGQLEQEEISKTKVKKSISKILRIVEGNPDFGIKGIKDFVVNFAPASARIVSLVKILDKTPDRRLSEVVGAHGRKIGHRA